MLGSVQTRVSSPGELKVEADLGGGAMRRARFRIRINQQIHEIDIVVGTNEQWESSSLAATSRWSINVQRGRIIAMRIVDGQSNATNDFNLSAMRRA